jgi:hypothetical protein
MRTLDGVQHVFAIEDAAVAIAKTTHDYWTLPMSLPLHCRTELSSIPVRIPYLHAPPVHRTIWSPRLPPANGKFRVGLVWKGNPMHANDAKRSLSGLSALAPLWAIEGIQFVKLQYGERTDEARDRLSVPDLLDFSSDIGDFADTAALLDRLDLLITVDTSVAHLAGALGKPCWVLLPAYRTDWRWMRARNDSPWYPDSMRLFRQGDDQNWSPVIEDLTLALREHIAQRQRPA